MDGYRLNGHLVSTVFHMNDSNSCRCNFDIWLRHIRLMNGEFPPLLRPNWRQTSKPSKLSCIIRKLT